jgi:YD repeat-containing protein
MMVSKVDDRFGNWVIYKYDTQSRLTKIHAKDGRKIELGYSEAAPFEQSVSSVTVNGRLWHYNLDLVGSKKPTGKGCDAIGADTNTNTNTATAAKKNCRVLRPLTPCTTNKPQLPPQTAVKPSTITTVIGPAQRNGHTSTTPKIKRLMKH